MADTRFRKTVDIKAVDADARTATGVVLEPDTLDHQGDFLRADAVANFHSPDPDTGVMHAAFPDDAATLTRNEVLADDDEIDGETFEAGQWVVTREYADDDLWQLVDDGVLTGFSIGGEIADAIDHDEVPEDVVIPDAVDHEAGMGATELVDGSVDEISDVDLPAVPAATYKADIGKSLFDEVDGEAEFVEIMTEQRGHDEADARELWAYVQAHADAEPSKADLLAALDAAKQDFPPWPYSEDPSDGFEECKQDMAGEVDDENAFCAEWMREALGVGPEELTQAHDMTDDSDEPDDATKWRRFKSWLAGNTDDDGTSEDPGIDDATAAKAAEVLKQGRPLNSTNRQALMAAHDAIEAALTSDLDFRTNRFTDDPTVDFDLSEFGKSTDDDTMTDTDTDTDTDTGDDEPPEWAKSLIETVEQNANQIDDLAARQRTVELEADGETIELTEAQVREAIGDDDAPVGDDAPEWAKSLHESVQENAERIERIGTQSGLSTQLGGTENGSDDGDEVEAFKAGLVGGGQ